ncbi:glutamate--tRNA ligase 1 [Candidatus Rickettsiella viridis]|uniref:Glutamate--tRNA ligase n=1 Tax=Candidatus Rickettsiella viridis TaxID=676208 RepID=A0A2Z5UVN8_9COXI|nr:glutamate--tRNA ligase [Candidatus Rickettsiella viridis]BBB15125.1 glutamate--tRNA ligase 1 [Candidatus Rickettsiella viridis]
MKVRTRFAPSPTGYLHIGGVRTALYSWLYAKKKNGEFILRIEDTDLERSTPEAVDIILEGLHWLGLSWDEGPFYQSQRLARYQAVLNQLLSEDKAYRCYCSKERLSALREEQLQQQKKPRYDGHCRDRKTVIANQPFVIRFRNPLEGEVVVADQVHGDVRFQNQELDDLIIARSDGSPTYNFTVVVDDWDMQITHVIRGDDHLNNTPRQINLLLALGAHLPIYAHVPMILGPDGKKLSKRQGAANVLEYREEGYLADALLNYLVRLGWSHGDQEIFSREEIINFFDIADLNKSPAAINPDKLSWLNQHYLKTDDPKQITQLLEKEMQQLGINTQGKDSPDLQDVVMLQRERVKTLREMAEKSRFFYEADFSVPQTFPADILSALKALQAQFIQLNDWTNESLHHALVETAAQFSLKLGKLAPALRLVVTGTSVSPPINVTLHLLGKKEVLARMEKALV